MLNKSGSVNANEKGKERGSVSENGNAPVLECRGQGHALTLQLKTGPGQGGGRGPGRCPVETGQGKGQFMVGESGETVNEYR